MLTQPPLTHGPPMIVQLSSILLLNPGSTLSSETSPLMGTGAATAVPAPAPAATAETAATTRRSPALDPIRPSFTAAGTPSTRVGYPGGLRQDVDPVGAIAAVLLEHGATHE